MGPVPALQGLEPLLVQALGLLVPVGSVQVVDPAPPAIVLLLRHHWKLARLEKAVWSGTLPLFQAGETGASPEYRAPENPFELPGSLEGASQDVEPPAALSWFPARQSAALPGTEGQNRVVDGKIRGKEQLDPFFSDFLPGTAGEETEGGK